MSCADERAGPEIGGRKLNIDRINQKLDEQILQAKIEEQSVRSAGLAGARGRVWHAHRNPKEAWR